MKTIKNACEMIVKMFGEFNANIKLFIINAVVAVLGIVCGSIKLYVGYTATWWQELFHHKELASNVQQGWILVTLGVITGILAITLYMREERKIKNFMDKLDHKRLKEETASAEDAVIVE